MRVPRLRPPSFSRRARRSLSAWGVLVLAGCLTAAGAAPGSPALGEAPESQGWEPGEIAPHLLYVCVQDEAEVVVIDMNTREVVRTISLTELGYPERSMPHDIAVAPDGSAWFVSLIGDNRVLRLDPEDRVVGEFRMETPGMLSMDASMKALVVSRSMGAVSPPARLGLVDPGEMTVEEVDIFFPRPHGVVVDREGGFAYSASLGVNQIASLELATEQVELVDVPGPTHAFVQLALSPDGSVLVASGELSGALVVFDLTANPARPVPVATVEVGPMAFDPIFSPDGAQVWLPAKGSDEVVVVETEGWTVVDRISGEGLLQPHAIAFSPDGSAAFVTNNNKDAHAMHHPGHEDGGPGTVVVIDTASRSIDRVLTLGRNVTGLGARPAP